MIRATDVTKCFGEVKAVDNISAEIKDNGVFGLVGTNGAGKSTFLRMLSGILKPDRGAVLIDDMHVFENTAAKSRCFYISDDQYFFPNSNAKEMRDYYAMLYPQFDKARCDSLLKSFDLDSKRKISTFSKGMKKQLSVVLAISANVSYIFCDETLDGLDPVMRRAVKSIFAGEVADKGLTPVIASHNLRELEDICDHVGLLHKGGLLLSRELDEMKLGLHKVQAVFPYQIYEQAFAELQLLSIKQSGNMYTMIIRGEREQIEQYIEAKRPIYMEMLPLSLEEAFICETEVAGYEFQELFI